MPLRAEPSTGNLCAICCKISEAPNTLLSSAVPQVASLLEVSVTSALDAGYRTGDLYSEGTKKVGCRQLGEILEGFIRQPVAAH